MRVVNVTNKEQFLVGSDNLMVNYNNSDLILDFIKNFNSKLKSKYELYIGDKQVYRDDIRVILQSEIEAISNTKLYSDKNFKDVFTNFILDNEMEFKSFIDFKDLVDEIETDSGIIKLSKKILTGIKEQDIISPKNITVNDYINLLDFSKFNSEELELLMYNIIFHGSRNKILYVVIDKVMDKHHLAWYEDICKLFDVKILILDTAYIKLPYKKFSIFIYKNLTLDEVEVESNECNYIIYSLNDIVNNNLDLQTELTKNYNETYKNYDNSLKIINNNAFSYS